MRDKVNIFWFRRDLRLHDNTGLYFALKDQLPVLPIFILDEHILNNLPSRSDPRVGFIHKQLIQLNNEFNKFEGSIYVNKGTPLNVFENLLGQYEISCVYTNRDYEPYAQDRDYIIERLLNKRGAKFLTFKDHVAFEKNDILKDDRKPYKIFTPYKKKWLQNIQLENLAPLPSENLLHNIYKKKFAFPSLMEIGMQKSNIHIPNNTFDLQILNNYENMRDYPAENGTSRLGIHFRFGTISIREAINIALQTSHSWLNELIWREFYMMILFHFPYVQHKAFNPKYEHIAWINNDKDFKAWCDGFTGYPLVDAGMRQLNTTGYMHNRVRMIVASFLAKHLLIDWRWGEMYFAQKLLDFELASNNGGWQWAAGTGTDAQPYFRIFNPTAQASKFDPKYKYIKKWVPEFGTKDYPNPIIDHKFARQRAIDTYKHSLKENENW